MRRPMPTAALAGAVVFACVSACAPHPIVARDPVPAPTGTESYACDTRRFPLNSAASDCEPRHRQERAVLQARG